MRTATLAFVNVLWLVTSTMPAGAVTTGPFHPEAGAAPRRFETVQTCPRGYHWVPAGYAKHGKWRDGHCSPN